MNLDWLCVESKTPLMEVLRRQAGAVERGLPAGIVLVTEPSGKLSGTVTDGDVRRAILKHGSLDLSAEKAMATNPIAFPSHMSYSDVLEKLPGELSKRGRREQKFLGKVILVDDQYRPVRVLEYHHLWEQRVATHRNVVVVGMGYVGLTLALTLADKGFHVTGFEVDATKVKNLNRGESHVHELGLTELLRQELNRHFVAADTLPNNGDVYVISVGTPVAAPHEGALPVPQMHYLESALGLISKKLKPGNLVVLRSTVPAGTTRNVVLPYLEKATGLRGGIDFHLAFAPERTAEGRALKELRTLPQIIGGLTPDSVEATVALFRELTPSIVRVESLEAAEMAKLLNNAFRDVVFGFANQVTQIASAFNIDPVELIRAANQGYIRDPIPLPSPGVGGPCLTKDPYIFASVAKQAGVSDTLSYAGRQANEAMCDFVVKGLLAELKRLGRDPKRCRIAVAGLAFKGEPETGDLRNSPSVDIALKLKTEVGEIFGHDPVVAAEEIRAQGFTPITDLTAGLKEMDALLILNNHRYYQKGDITAWLGAMKKPAVLVDGWHLYRPEDVLHAGPSVYLGLGFSRRSEGTA